MTVLDILNKVKDIENIQRLLGAISDRPQTSNPDKDTLGDAIDMLDDYIHELMCKEVKEKNV